MENINTFTKNDKLVKALKILFKSKKLSVFIKNYEEFLYHYSGLEGYSFEYEIHKKIDDSVICKSIFTYEFAKIDQIEGILGVLLKDVKNNNLKWYWEKNF